MSLIKYLDGKSFVHKHSTGVQTLIFKCDDGEIEVDDGVSKMKHPIESVIIFLLESGPKDFVDEMKQAHPEEFI